MKYLCVAASLVALSVLALSGAIAGDGGASKSDAAPVTEKTKTFCKYTISKPGGNPVEYSYCTDASVDVAKADCDKKATEKAGEPIECYCTDDPDYIGDRCG